MDYRRRLFQLEQLSPNLAKKLWAWTPIFKTPLRFLSNFKVKVLTDFSVELEIGQSRNNTNESGDIEPGIIMMAAEWATKVLWQRHLNPDLESLFLKRINSDFLISTKLAVRLRAELKELEREELLRRLRAGQEVDQEMVVTATDSSGKTVATLKYDWSVRPLFQNLLKGGGNELKT